MVGLVAEAFELPSFAGAEAFVTAEFTFAWD
jgi:hypothetical protein